MLQPAIVMGKAINKIMENIREETIFLQMSYDVMENEESYSGDFQ